DRQLHDGIWAGVRSVMWMHGAMGTNARTHASLEHLARLGAARMTLADFFRVHASIEQALLQRIPAILVAQRFLSEGFDLLRRREVVVEAVVPAVEVAVVGGVLATDL